MCSIAGVTEFDSGKLVESLLELMKHRAPDDKGVYRDENISLGMGRLKIIDLSSKNLCPYINKDLVLAFNGEIYNYKELREELIQFGFNFETNGDTEVLLKGYIKHGSNILSKLRGQFAFAIYDRENNELFLARDRVGIKPVYYLTAKNNFIFSSELKAIENLGLVNRANT